jgi:hypothetical protein
MMVKGKLNKLVSQPTMRWKKARITSWIKMEQKKC